MRALGCIFETERLQVQSWAAENAAKKSDDHLASFVVELMIPEVTVALPPGWQGDFDIPRARQWIMDRDREAEVLLLVDKSSSRAVGLLLLFSAVDLPDQRVELNLGYLLERSSWGKGFASELINGLVKWCELNGVAELVGGVAADNVASQRVLLKNGFELDSAKGSDDHFIYNRRFPLVIAK